MKPEDAYRTDLPAERPDENRASYVWRGTQPAPQAADNVAPTKVLLYGPNGEALDASGAAPGRLPGAATMIGQWASRPKTLWHFVESRVADRLVMRCGRELNQRADKPWTYVNERPAVVCYQCGRKPA